MYRQEPDAWQPTVPRGRVITLGVIKIVLSSFGMALSIVGLVGGILELAIRHNLTLGLILLVASVIGLGLFITLFVQSIVSLARRVGTVNGRSSRARRMRWPSP